jgi:murein DD-endopeptidase MepM/ murein hydrolase activator NlpD
MRVTRMFRATIRTSVALLLAALSYTTAEAKAPAVKVVSLAPTAGGVVVFEPQAPRTPDAPPTAILNLDIRLRNDEAASVELKSIAYKFTYGNGKPPGGVIPPVIYLDIKKALSGDEAPFIPKGLTRRVMLPSAYAHRYPLPTGVTVELSLAGFADPLVVYTRLGEYRNRTPTGSYRFPGRAEDLAPGVKHPGNKDGTIPNGGNGLWVDHGNGEFALYAHFQKNSVPPSLCPKNGNIEANHPVVKAGDQLGNAGNSGESSGPHLHFHVQDGPPATGQGVPTLFHGIRVSTDTNSPDGLVVVVRKSPPTGPVFIEPYKLSDKIQTSVKGEGDGPAATPDSNRALP